MKRKDPPVSCDSGPSERKNVTDSTAGSVATNTSTIREAKIEIAPVPNTTVGAIVVTDTASPIDTASVIIVEASKDEAKILKEAGKSRFMTWMSPDIDTDDSWGHEYQDMTLETSLGTRAKPSPLGEHITNMAGTTEKETLLTKMLVYEEKLCLSDEEKKTIRDELRLIYNNLGQQFLGPVKIGHSPGRYQAKFFHQLSGTALKFPWPQHYRFETTSISVNKWRDHVPLELMQKILSFVSWTCRFRLIRVCRAWQTAAITGPEFKKWKTAAVNMASLQLDPKDRYLQLALLLDSPQACIDPVIEMPLCYRFSFCGEHETCQELRLLHKQWEPPVLVEKPFTSQEAESHSKSDPTHAVIDIPVPVRGYRIRFDGLERDLPVSPWLAADIASIDTLRTGPTPRTVTRLPDMTIIESMIKNRTGLKLINIGDWNKDAYSVNSGLYSRFLDGMCRETVRICTCGTLCFACRFNSLVFIAMITGRTSEFWDRLCLLIEIFYTSIQEVAKHHLLRTWAVLVGLYFRKKGSGFDLDENGQSLPGELRDAYRVLEIVRPCQALADSFDLMNCLHTARERPIWREFYELQSDPGIMSIPEPKRHEVTKWFGSSFEQWFIALCIRLHGAVQTDNFLADVKRMCALSPFHLACLDKIARQPWCLYMKTLGFRLTRLMDVIESWDLKQAQNYFIIMVVGDLVLDYSLNQFHKSFEHTHFWTMTKCMNLVSVLVRFKVAKAPGTEQELKDLCGLPVLVADEWAKDVWFFAEMRHQQLLTIHHLTHLPTSTSLGFIVFLKKLITIVPALTLAEVQSIITHQLTPSRIDDQKLRYFTISDVMIQLWTILIGQRPINVHVSPDVLKSTIELYCLYPK